MLDNPTSWGPMEDGPFEAKLYTFYIVDRFNIITFVVVDRSTAMVHNDRGWSTCSGMD